MAEGVDLCLFVVRLKVKNRMLVDVLTGSAPERRPIRVWEAFARAELRSLARQARSGSRRVQRLKELTQDAAGTAWSAHDYRHSDAPHLERRARAGRAVAVQLGRIARARPSVRALLREAAAAAIEEITSSADRSGLDTDDARLVRQYLEPIQRVADLDSDRRSSPA